MNATPGSCTAEMPFGFQPEFKGLYIAAELIVAVLAITGNFLVCLAVAHNKKLRTVTNYFLVRSLSIPGITSVLKYVISFIKYKYVSKGVKSMFYCVSKGVPSSGRHPGGLGGHSLCSANRPGSTSP